MLVSRMRQDSGTNRRRGRSRTETVLLGVWVASVFIAGAAWAHDWRELAPGSFEAAELGAALAAAEALQAEIDPDGALALPADAWAFEWWRWFGVAVGLGDSAGTAALASALAASGFPHDGDEAVTAWREVMEHLVAAADAGRLRAVDPAELEAAFDGTGPVEDAVRLSHLAAIAGEPPPDAALEPFLARFEALLAAARGLAR